MNNKYSIVVPVYNVSNYLTQCIESVIDQTTKDWELILVNDGSTDDSLTICQKYANKYNNIKLVNKENGGLVSARKAGAMEAQGDYILCLDGDDWLEKNTLSFIEEIVQKYERVDIVCYGIVSVTEDQRINNPFVNRFGFYNRNQIIDEIFPMLIQDKDASYFAPSLCGKAIKRELYIENQMKVDDCIVIGEDGACTIPAVLASNSLFILDKYMYYYRNNAESITKKKKPLSWDGPGRLLKHLHKVTEKEGYDFTEQINRRIVHELFRVSVTRFYGSRSYREVKKEINEQLYADEMRAVIRNSHFSMKLKPKLMEIAIKKRLVFLMYCYSRIK